jgi:hypothetical protein
MKVKYFLFLFFLIILPFLYCTFDEPVMPRWVTKFLIPISTETYIFSEEIANDSTIVTKGDSLYIDIRGDFETKELSSEDLSLPDADSTHTTTLKKITISLFDTMTTGTINITDPFPEIGNFIGLTVPIPDTTLPGIASVTRSDFYSIKVTSGTLELVFINNLPFTLTPESPGSNSIAVSVDNEIQGTHVTDIFITDTISPGDTAIGIAPLGSGDGWIHMPLRLNYSLHVAADTVFVTQDSLDAWNFRFDLIFMDLELEEITGWVESQTFNDTLTAGLGEQENTITEAIFADGSIEVTLKNTLPLGTQGSFTLPDLSLNGQPYIGNFDIPPYDSVTVTVEDLEGYRIYNSRYPGQPLDSLSIISQVVTSSDSVILRATDEITVRFQSTDIQFSYFKGHLAKDTLELDPILEEDIIDNTIESGFFEIQGAQLIFHINNGLNIDSIIYNGQITGYHKRDGIYTNSKTIYIENQMIVPGENTITLMGSDIDSLVSLIPIDIEASGHIIFSGNAEVSVGDAIESDYIFTTPFQIQILNPDSIKMDPDTLTEDDIDEDFRDKAGDDIRTAELIATIINNSPLGSDVHFFVSADPTREDLYDTTSYFNPDLEFIKSTNVTRAIVNPSTGYVITPTENHINFRLSKEEISIFKYPPLRIGILLVVEETDTFVVLHGSDYLEVSGEFQFELLFKEEE